MSDNDYDPLNRLIKTLQDVGGINAKVEYSYDALDRLTTVNDPKSLNTVYAYDGLSNLKSLKKGWNGYEAEGFPESFILKLEELISELEYQPKIFPTGRGTIQIEYKRDNGDYLEIELNEDSGNVYCERDGESLEKEVPLNRINEQVNEFHS